MNGFSGLNYKRRSLGSNDDLAFSFLSKRVHPLLYIPTESNKTLETDLQTPKISQNPLKLQNLQTPKKKKLDLNKFFRLKTHKKQSFKANSPSNLYSLQIPPLKYESFRKDETLLQSKKRKISLNNPPMLQFLYNKYHIPMSSKHSLSKQLTIKESKVNQKAYKRIESSQIAYPAKTLGEKLVRVQELVIDPLMKEGNFFN